MRQWRWDDASDDFDDPDEPIMEGSDNDFSNVDDVDKDDGNNELDDDAAPSEDSIAPPQILVWTPDLDSAAANSEPQWTTTLKQNKINSFTHPVGPAVAIQKSPLEVFQLFFTPELLDMMCRRQISMLNK